MAYLQSIIKVIKKKVFFTCIIFSKERNSIYIYIYKKDKKVMMKNNNNKKIQMLNVINVNNKVSLINEAYHSSHEIHPYCIILNLLTDKFRILCHIYSY